MARLCHEWEVAEGHIRDSESCAERAKCYLALCFGAGFGGLKLRSNHEKISEVMEYDI